MVTTEKEYNGWSNIETWNVQLWISNTEPLYKLVKASSGYCGMGRPQMDID